MKIESVTADRMPLMGNVENAHAAVNAAYNALALDRTPAALPANAKLARQYVAEAHQELAGHDGLSDANDAARAVLPRLEHALALLDALGIAPDPINVAPLLDELGVAMDHMEAALAAVGWE